MTDYKKLYYQLFNRVTDLITELQQIQIEAEERFMNEMDEDDEVKREEAEWGFFFFVA